MKKVTAFQAKVHFSRLLARARKGERITITHHGVPVADLVPHAPAPLNVRAIVDRMRSLRRTRKKRTSVEEVLRLRDEGRR
jgi:prevent-host-death family protein